MNDVNNACSCPSGDGSLLQPCSAHPAPADVQPGGRVRLGDGLRPCPFCGHSDFDQWPCEYIDASGANVVRCARCHAAAPMKVWHALSAQPSPGGQVAPRCARHCQNGFADICLASQRDGAICPEDSCDIDDGIRHNHLAARQPVNGLSWADYWTKRGQPDAAHDFDAFSRAEAWALQRFPDARQPVGEPVEKTDGEVAAQFFADHPALALRYWHEHIRRPLTHVPTTREASPYFECSAEQWERHTTGMTDGGKQRLANMVAHHCLLARRDDRGWIITRFDLIRSGKPWWHVSNDGVLTYDYDPATKERKVAAPPAQAVDLGQFREAVAYAARSADFATHVEIGSKLRELLALIDSQAVGQ